MFAERAAKNGSERRENRNSFFPKHTQKRALYFTQQRSRSFRRVICCLLDGRRQSRRPKNMYSSEEEEEEEEEDAMCVCVCVCARTDGVVVCAQKNSRQRRRQKEELKIKKKKRLYLVASTSY